MHLDSNGLPLAQIYVSANVEEAVGDIEAKLMGQLHQIFYHEDILVEHAKEVIKAAYIAESQVKYLVIAGLTYRVEVQNALLKILEEPPKNIRFIVVVPSKTLLLPTILSRLVLWHQKSEKRIDIQLDFHFSRFDLAQMYTFIKQHDRISRKDLQTLLEQLFLKASRELGKLSSEQCDVFAKGYKLLALNANQNTVLTTVLLHFVI